MEIRKFPPLVTYIISFPQFHVNFVLGDWNRIIVEDKDQKGVDHAIEKVNSLAKHRHFGYSAPIGEISSIS
jgi:hypothetical protein